MNILKHTAALLVSAAALIPSASAQLSLTILHNNDGESKVLPLTGADADHGGAAHFVGLVKSEKARAAAAGRQVLTVSSGDNFLAGVTYAAGQGVPSGAAPNTYYDARVISAVAYDAVAFGNHDFDFGPATLAEFIAQTDAATFYVNTNADFSGEAALNPLVGSKLLKSRIVVKGGVKIGIVSAITPQLPTISTPGGVTVPTPTLADIAAAINAETLAIKTADADVKIFVLLSHLQSLNEEVALTPQLVDVDVVVSGGGSEFLRGTTPPHPAAEVLPSDLNAARFGTYPLSAVRTSDTKAVPIVTTKGEYRYLGRLEVEFDAAGHVVTSTAGSLPGTTDSADGALPVKHAGSGGGAILPDATVQSTVIDPVNAFVAQLSANVLDDNLAVALDGTRTSVRSRETNEGNLLADAILFKARQLAAASGGSVDAPVIAFTNGGGMRKDAVIAAGTNFTELTTFEIAAFPNFIAVLEDVTPQKLKSLLESAYSQTSKNATTGAVQATGSFTGRFAQVAGLTVNYNILGAASTLTPQGNVIADGARVRDVTLADGTQLYIDGVLNPALPAGFTIDVATVDFLARGGDGYPLAGTPFTQFVGETYQEALEEYVTASLGDGGLGGTIDAPRYAGPVGRVVPQSRPDVVNVVRTAVDRQTAKITNNVRTNGYPTTATLQYGPTASYGTTLTLAGPLAAQPLGTNTAQTWNIPGLQPGVVYQFRINATNELGTISTSNSTFTASPNAAPLAVADAIFVATTSPGVPVAIPIATLLANDSDANTDPLTLRGVSNPLGGSIGRRGANVLFTPDSFFDGFGSFSYTVADSFGFAATGEVIVRSSAALTAEYAASIDGPAGQSGFAKLKVGSGGAFSGSLLLNGVRSGFRGTIGSSGITTVTIPRSSPLAPLTLTLEFDLTGDLTAFTGTLSDGTEEFALTGHRAAGAAAIAHLRGQFNVGLTAEAGGPTGTGFLVAKVTTSGSVTLAGKLADGTAVSMGTLLNANLEIPVFVAIYRNPVGLLAGVLAHPDAGALAGNLAWSKPPQASSSPFLATGFETTVSASGRRYVKPPTRSLPAGFAAAPAPFTLTLAQGGIASPIVNTGTLAPTGVATIGAGSANPALKVNFAAGTFTGAFAHPVGGVRTTFSGALIDAGIGAGSFVTTSASGAVTLIAD